MFGMNTGLSDNEIISKVLQGDTPAYSVLVDRYRSYVFTLTLRMVKTREDAEEIAQDVFVKAFRYLADFRGTAKFTTWLYTIVNNTCISFLRKKKLDWHSLDDDKVAARAENIEGAVRVETIESRSSKEMVTKAINMLSPDDAQAISLFYLAEQSLEEMASVLGVEVNTAKVRLHRARTRLREKMQARFATEVKDLN